MFVNNELYLDLSFFIDNLHFMLIDLCLRKLLPLDIEITNYVQLLVEKM